MKLWFIACDRSGESFDWFIAAHSLFDAKACWAAIPMVHGYGLDRNDIDGAFEVQCANINNGILAGPVDWDREGQIRKIQ